MIGSCPVVDRPDGLQRRPPGTRNSNDVAGRHWHARLHDLLASVQVPALVTVGGADHGFMRDTARDMLAALPDAQFGHLVGARHDAGPDVVAPPLVRFLRA